MKYVSITFVFLLVGLVGPGVPLAGLAQTARSLSSVPAWITPVNTVTTRLSAGISRDMSRWQAMPDKQDMQLITLGNLAMLQQAGRFSFTLPGRARPLQLLARRVNARSPTDYDWYGELTDRPGSLNLTYRQGKVTASLVVDNRTYLIFHLEGDMHLLYRHQDQGSVSCPVPAHKSLVTSTAPAPAARYERSCNSFSRVLVLYTAATAAAVVDINQVAMQGVSDFNACVYNANVTSLATLELAGVAQVNLPQSPVIDADMDALIASPVCQQLRQQYLADLVILIVGGDYPPGTSYGLAGSLDLEQNRAYAITTAGAAIGGRHTFAHELGHLFALHHDDDFAGGGAQYRDYAHGYRYSTWGGFYNRSTIMASVGPTSYRDVRFSNPDVIDAGTPTGTPSRFNDARRIGETYVTVREFMPDVPRPFAAYIDGPQNGLSRAYYTWSLSTACSVESNTYEWRTSFDGFSWGPVLSMADSYGEYLPCPSGDRYYIQLRVQTGNGQVSTAVQTVQLDKQRCNSYYSVVPGGGGQQVSSVAAHNSMANETTATVPVGKDAPTDPAADVLSLSAPHPNPATDWVEISYTVVDADQVRVVLLDAAGRIVRTLDGGFRTPGGYRQNCFVGNVSAGLYVCQLTANGHVLTRRLLIAR